MICVQKSSEKKISTFYKLLDLTIFCNLLALVICRIIFFQKISTKASLMYDMYALRLNFCLCSFKNCNKCFFIDFKKTVQRLEFHI